MPDCKTYRLARRAVRTQFPPEQCPHDDCGYREALARVTELEAEVESLKVQLAAAREDTERLNWLEKHAQVFDIHLKDRVDWRIVLPAIGPLRAAIDADRAARKDVTPAKEANS